MIGWASRQAQSAAGWMSVPWPSFVAAFLYYAALTALVLGGISPAWTLLAGAYAGPLVVYAFSLTWRAMAAMGSAVRRRVPSGMAHAPLVWQ